MHMKVKTSQRSFVVIGLGTFGSTVATELARYGNHVLGICKDEHNVSRLASTLADAIIADGRDEEALRQAGVGDYDVALVAIGEDLEANILCTMNVKLLGIPVVWAKASTRTHHRILSKIGADRVIHPEQEMGQHVAEMLHNPLVRNYLSLGNNYYIVDFMVPGTLDGKTVDELKLGDRFDIRCIGLMRGTEYFECATEVRLEAEDKLLLLGRRDELRGFGDALQ
jgi:trk/ktr system potassium uptake protein